MLGQRWLRLAFLCSLASNFFLLALGLSLYLERPTAFPPPPEAVMEKMASQLSSEGEAIFRSTFEKHRTQIAERREALRDANAEVRRLAGAESLDLEALKNQRTEARQVFANFMRSLDGFILEVLPQLSAEDRRRIAHAVPQ